MSTNFTDLLREHPLAAEVVCEPLVDRDELRARIDLHGGQDDDSGV